MTLPLTPSSRQRLLDAPEGRERLSRHLIHVVVAVRRQPPDEPYIRSVASRELFVLLVQLGILRARDRVIGIALGARDIRK